MYIKMDFMYTLTKMCLLFMILCAQGCSIVQWMPSSACENVEYIRVGNQVSIKADCTV